MLTFLFFVGLSFTMAAFMIWRDIANYNYRRKFFIRKL